MRADAANNELERPPLPHNPQWFGETGCTGFYLIISRIVQETYKDGTETVWGKPRIHNQERRPDHESAGKPILDNLLAGPETLWGVSSPTPKKSPTLRLCSRIHRCLLSFEDGPGAGFIPKGINNDRWEERAWWSPRILLMNFCLDFRILLP